MNILGYIIISYTILYILMMLRVSILVRETDTSKQEKSFTDGIKISVIVPFRNEAQNIEKCVQSILAQKTTIDFEIILVNDHSEDDFPKSFKTDKIRLIDLENSEFGKKKAISKGVDCSTGSIILTIDADCIAPNNWLDSVASNFNDDTTQMSMGSVYVEENGRLISLIQSSESLILGLFTKYGVASKSPFLASGANLAYRKKAFQEVKGFFGNDSVSSGDDMFLLEKVQNHFGVNTISFHAAETITASVSTLPEFLNQRVRWFKKMKYIKELRTNYFSLFIGGINQLLLFTLIFPPFHSLEIVGFILAKYFIDLFLLSRAGKTRKTHLLFSPIYFVWNLVYPIIILIALVVVKPKWKGRIVS